MSTTQDDEGPIDFLGTAPRMPARPLAATPEQYVLLGAGIATMLVIAAVDNLLLNRWLAVMAAGGSLFAAMLFFSGVWQNWRDDKVPLVVSLVIWNAIVGNAWRVLSGPRRYDYVIPARFARGMLMHVGLSASWSALDAVGRGWRFAAAVALASATGWLLYSAPQRVRRRQYAAAALAIAASVAFSCVVWSLVN